VVTVAPNDTLLTALARMRLYDISQLPVLEGERVVGMLDESDVLLSAIDDAARLKSEVASVMSTRLETVDVKTEPRALLPLFARGLVPLVFDGPSFVGLVTRIDVLNHLRRRLR
jgi:cystathionine beta-synthase